MSKSIHSCMTKAVVADGNQLEFGPQWITSRRGMLKLHDQHLECGDWKIPYDDFQEAVLSSFRSPILRIQGYVLAIRTDTKTYHFGLNGGRFWTGDLPFAVHREKSRLRLSPVSFCARIALVFGLIYLVWERWG